MGFPRALGWIAVSAVLFGLIGATIGYSIGILMPEYFRSIFQRDGDADFSPSAVGMGQGLTQGVLLGSLIGLILVLASWWKEYKLALLYGPEATELSDD
jgi:hypothetical protein